MITYETLKEKEEILFHKARENNIPWYGTDDLIAEYRLDIEWFENSGVYVYNDDQKYFHPYRIYMYKFDGFIDIALCLKYAVVMASIAAIDTIIGG
jgi:hypothetical protein